MSFFRRFVWIFASPYKVYDEIRESRVGWWQPWIIVSVLFMIATWIAAPLQQAVMEMNPQFEDQDVSGQAGMMRNMGVIMSPAMALIMTAVVAGITYILVTLMSREATFKKYFTLLFFANIVYAVGYLLTMVLLRMRGVENITSPEDMHLSLSLRMLAPEASTFLRGLLGSIEFFSIWGLVLVVLGLRSIFGLRTGQAVACVIPLFIIYAAIAVLSEFFIDFGQ